MPTLNLDSATDAAGPAVMMTARNTPKKPDSALPLIARVLGNEWLGACLSPLERHTKARKLIGDGATVLTTNYLSEKALRALFAHEILAIRVPGFCSPQVCDSIAQRALHKEIRNWNVRDVKQGYKESDVDVFGSPFNMAIKGQDVWDNYFRRAQELSQELRDLASPHAYPLDTFRSQVDEHWPSGLMAGTYGGHKMVPGLVRIMKERGQNATDIPLNCHVDTTPILARNHGQYSVNIYLRPAASGGSLFIWDTRIRLLDIVTRWFVVKNFFLQSNYLDESLQRRFQAMLPPPTEVPVEKGDLVMLNTARPHAISAFIGGPRVSLQAFVTYKRGEPLKLWA